MKFNHCLPFSTLLYTYQVGLTSTCKFVSCHCWNLAPIPSLDSLRFTLARPSGRAMQARRWRGPSFKGPQGPHSNPEPQTKTKNLD